MSQTKTDSGWFLKALFVGDHEQNKSEDNWQQLSNHGILVTVTEILPHFLYFRQVFVEPSAGNSIKDAKLLEHLGTVALLKAFNSGTWKITMLLMGSDILIIKLVI